jgi:hypothetical protein
VLSFFGGRSKGVAHLLRYVSKHGWNSRGTPTFPVRPSCSSRVGFSFGKAISR